MTDKIYVESGYHRDIGYPKGTWVSLDLQEDEFWSILDGIKHNNDDTIIVTDYDTEYKIPDIVDLQKLWEFHNSISLMDTQDVEKIYYLLWEHPYDFDNALLNYKNVTIYYNTTLLELAQEFIQDHMFGEITESLRSHIDYDSVANDLHHNGYIQYRGHVFNWS